MIYKCKCGSTGFTKKTPMRGVWIERLISLESGFEILESSTDGLSEGKRPKTITCDTCGKRHPNPK